MSGTPVLDERYTRESNEKVYLLLKRMITKNPWDMQVVPVNANVRDYARQNDKRPAYLTVSVPDNWVLNACGWESLSDAYLMLRIPRNFVEAFEKEKEGRDPTVIIKNADGTIVEESKPE